MDDIYVWEMEIVVHVSLLLMIDAFHCRWDRQLGFCSNHILCFFIVSTDSDII